MSLIHPVKLGGDGAGWTSQAFPFMRHGASITPNMAHRRLGGYFFKIFVQFKATGLFVVLAIKSSLCPRNRVCILLNGFD